MEFKINKKEIVIKHTLKKSENFKFLKRKRFETLSVFKKPIEVRGIASSCEDGHETLFADFDQIAKYIVINDFLNVQKEYKLPPAYLFATKEEEVDGETIGNYHLISLIKLKPREAFEIISHLHCDLNYTSMPIRNKWKNWVLRISNKGKRNGPKFLGIIGVKKNLSREISKPHLDFLSRIYNLPKINYSNLDKCKNVYLHKYTTVNI